MTSPTAADAGWATACGCHDHRYCCSCPEAAVGEQSACRKRIRFARHGFVDDGNFGIQLSAGSSAGLADGDGAAEFAVAG